MSSNEALVSVRVAEAQRRAEERLRHERDLLRPLGWALIAVVVASAATQQQATGPSGRGPAVGLLALVTAGYAASTALVVGERFPSRPERLQLSVLVVMAVCGVAISWLEPSGGTSLAAGAAAWMAITRLGLGAGGAVAVGAAAGSAAATARSGGVSAALAVVLLTALLGLVAYLLRQGRESQSRTEVLLAELADARDAEAQAAVVTERGRIAAELHDVLAHALSGAALQLQGARMIADRDGAGGPLTEAIDRAAQLVVGGLANARQAVQALRGTGISPTEQLAQLERLVEDCRRDLQLEVTLDVQGTPEDLRPELTLAFYRGVEEALTNAARHAPGSIAHVSVGYLPDRSTLQVDTGTSARGRTTPHGAEAGAEAAAALVGHGGGNGLAGMRDRIERLGGTMDAGPVEGGWRVALTVPNAVLQRVSNTGART